MIRRVPVKSLRPGMYISHIPANWFAHPFWRPSFRIRSHRDIEQLTEAGIPEVMIDTRRGLDLEEPPRPPRLRQQSIDEIDRRVRDIARQRQQAARASVSLAEERWRVRLLQQDAAETIHDLMNDVRGGRRLDIARTEPLVEKMVDSVRRHPDALIPLLQLKEASTYNHQHSLSVAAMTVALGATLRLSEQELLESAQGALLQDVGTARISERILNKATPLTDLEYLHVRSHVGKSQAILEEARGVSELSLAIVSQHHERIDGTGYPHRLAGEQVSLHAQVTAIVDVYDALTSDRPYHGRIEPAAALRQIYALAGGEFREDLVKAFIKTLGVYPVGSLVLLENGYLAVVLEQNRDHLLKPVVRTIYNTRSRHYIQPQVLDLAHRLEVPTIVGAESYGKWGIDPRRWQPL